MNDNLSGYKRVIEFLLKALVFLTPLLFLTVPSETREFNKQALIFFFVIAILGVWVVRVLTTRSVSWIKTSLDYAVLSYLGVFLLACLTSIDKVSSFLGYYGRFTGSFFSIISLVVLYFLIVNNVRNHKIASSIIRWLIYSSFLVIVYSLLQLLDVRILQFVQEREFNPVGSMVALSIFTAAFIVLYQWYWTSQKPGLVMKIALGVGTVISLVLLLMINALIAWLVLAIGLAAFVILNKTVLNWKALILIVAISFVGFKFLPQNINPRQVEAQLSNSATWSLVGNSLKSGSKQAMLGSGPGTTGIAFGQIKPEDLNKSVVWNLNFDRGSSEVANILIETGILGLIAFESLSLLFLFYALVFLIRRSRDHEERAEALGFFIFWLVIYVSHFFYFFSTTLYFLYFLFLGLFMAVTYWQKQESESRATLSLMFGGSVVLSLGLLVGFFQIMVYASEISYASGIKNLNQSQPNFEEVNEKFSRAISLNKYRDVYYLAYAQNLIFLASQEVAKDESDTESIQRWIASAIDAGKDAVKISPHKSSNHSSLAQLYTSIRPLGIEGTDQAIIQAWESAIAEDDSNPSLWIQLGKAYSTAAEVIDPSIAGNGTDSDLDGLSDVREVELKSSPQNKDSNNNGVADGDEVRAGFNPSGAGRLSTTQINPFIRLDNKMVRSAEEAFRKSIDLKDDLLDSRLGLARLYEKDRRLDKARAELDEIVRKFPGNIDVKFEQGRIAYNQGDITGAEKIFLELVKIQPKHANAHFALGLLYEKQGQREKALAEYEKTREITGPNVDLERRINSLKDNLKPPPEPEPQNP